jgi:uncharacterized protein
MPKAIADTSPIQYLYQTNLLDLLPNIYGEILIPQAVNQELAAGRVQGVALPNPSDLSWIRVCCPQNTAILPDITELGLGERESLALAMEMTDSLLILDDGLARRYARQLGLRFTGTLGVPIKAKQTGKLTTVSPVLDQLNQLRFRLDSSTRSTVLKLAGEI